MRGVLASIVGLHLLGSQAWAESPAIHFRVPTPTRPISPYIYGFGTYLHEDRKAEKVWDLRPSIYRWGGNTSSRFNYKIDAWSSGADYFFHNYGGPRGMIDQFMAENLKQGAATMITLPMLPWIAKDRESSSFPRQLFPVQQSFEGGAGNGLDAKGKALTADPKRTSVANDPSFVATWVQHLKKQFGSHPHFYIMDNEPMLWHVTHRDVHPEPLRYDTYLQRYLNFAKAVRQADPEAVIVGPAAWGWMEMQYSAYDIEGPWNNGQKLLDRKAHGNKPLLEWFLQEVAAAEKIQKMSLLDVLDVHYYPEKDRWPAGDDSQPARRQALLASTRSLWDRSFRDQSWIDEPIYLIPRLQALAKAYKPSLKVSLGEYNFRAERDLSGALAQAEVLGIFAQTDLYAAHFWDFPRRDQSPWQGFELYRNYDGKGSGFGTHWIENDWGARENLSVFAALDPRRKKGTIVLIQKDSKVQTVSLDLSPWKQVKSLKLFSYEAKAQDGEFKSRQQILKVSVQPKLSLAPLSMHLLEFTY